MMSDLGSDVVPDCVFDDSENDIKPQPGFTPSDLIGVKVRQPRVAVEHLGVRTSRRSQGGSMYNSDSVSDNSKQALTADAVSEKRDMGVENANCFVNHEEDGIKYITDDMIEDGAHVVFDWDNTLKLYDTKTKQLSLRVDKKFLLHLKNDRHCKLYVISAIRPSAMNLSTILLEIEKLRLTDVFVNVGFKKDGCDQVDGVVEDKPVVKPSEYAHKGNVIICGYDKAETFLKLSMFDASKGDKVVFFDDEYENVYNFHAIVPNSTCYFCK
ncbi:uncharacterized protein [Littorina saxatilis]|uniref:uncharacterized protein n=1 Tax=Littorina saxatilis TaxID=31220 RepID=UPI0038B4F78E